MKKLLSLLLAAAMLLAVAPMTVSAYPNTDEGRAALEAELKVGDLALNKTVIYSSTLDQGAGAAWTPGKLNDGSLNYNGNDTTGFHSQHATVGCQKNHEEWAGVDFGEVTEFNTVVIYPSDPGNGTCPGFPNAFRVQVSNNGEDWATPTIWLDGEEQNAAQTIYNFDPPDPEPVTIHFNTVKARYVRFVGVSLNFANNDGFYLKLSEMAVYNRDYAYTGYTYHENVLANKPVTVSSNGELNKGAHEDGNNNWHLVNINNGDRYEMVTFGYNNDYGQFAGFHSMPAQQERLELDFELDDGTTLNQFVIYPGSEKFAGTAHTGNADKFYFPANFSFAISNDGTNWTTVKTVEGYSVTKYEPQVFDLDQVYTAKYLRFTMLNLTNYVKLSELEAYDTTKTLTGSVEETPVETVEEKNTDLATGTSVIASGVINSGGWNVSNLNDGIIEDNGGFTSNNGGNNVGARLWVGYDMGAVTKMNAVVLFSANSTDERDANWSGIPRKFEIQVCNDLFSWETVSVVDNGEQAPTKMMPYTYTFTETYARYVRILATESYPKGSDGNNCYIQLAEMQVFCSCNDGTLVKTGDTTGTITADTLGKWANVKERENDFDLRVVLADNGVVQAGDTVTITFYKADGTLARDESISLPVSTNPADKGNNDAMYLFGGKVSAAGIEYTPDGCSIFGCVVTGIPKGGFDQAVITITRNGLVVMPDSTVAYSTLIK